MISSSVSVPIDLQKDSWIELPVKVNFHTSIDNTIAQILLDAEAGVTPFGATAPVVNGSSISGNNGSVTVISPLGNPIQVRFTVDGKETYPSEFILTSSTAIGCYATFCTARVNSGPHVVKGEYFCKGGGRINNLSIAVWAEK